MDKPRRSNRTPKPKAALKEKVPNPEPKAAMKEKVPKAEVKAKVPKANSNDKNDVKTAVAAIKQVDSVGNKQVLKKERTLGTFVIYCDVVGDKGIDLGAFKKYLQEKIKVEGKRNDPRVKTEEQNNKILIHADVFIEKTYIKYLIKLFLKGKKLNNQIRIINGKRSYTLEYFEKK